MKTFNMRKYLYDQIIDALTCPVNRHGTRVEHGCSDEELYLHPDWLVEHYATHGGAIEFAKRRDKYWIE